MTAIFELTEIPKKKLGQIVECLDDLLTYTDQDGEISPVITGYNWYATVPVSDRIVTFSHIHETEAYKQDMLRDLEKQGYSREEIENQIRDKGAAFLWELPFVISDNKGNVLPNLKIKDVRTKKYLSLERYNKSLEDYVEFRGKEGCLVGENKGWELDMPFRNKQELLLLVNLFLTKSGRFLYDGQGLQISETDAERKERKPWSDAYTTPVLLLGKNATKFALELPHFAPATRIHLVQNNNEISFVINLQYERLRSLSHYLDLVNLGFTEEFCLGNKPFIDQYVDKTR